MKFILNLVKQEENKKEVNRPDNLSDTPYFVHLLNDLKGSPMIPSMPDQKQKKFIEQKLEQLPSDQINYDFIYEKTEKVRLLKHGQPRDPVFEGEVKFPKHLRKEDETLESVNYRIGDMR